MTEEDLAMVKTIMSGIGTCDVVPEYQLDAAGALVGCGPAYVSIDIKQVLTAIWFSFW